MEFGDDIQRYLDNEPVRACPPSRLYAIQKFVSKHRGAVVTVALTSILLIAGTAISTAFAFRANRAESIANTATEIAEEKADVAQAISLFLRDDLLRASLADGVRDAGLSLQEALDQAAVQIEGRFKGKPLIEAEIRSVLGLAYESVGEIPTAKRHFDRALTLFEETRGADHVDTLRAEFRRVRLRLAYDKTSSLSDVERSVAAADALKDLLRRQESSLGPTNENTLVTKGFLALCYSRMERYREAMQLFDETNKAFAETLPPTDPRAIHCLEQTAACLSAQGRDSEANALLASRPIRHHTPGFAGREDAEALVVKMQELVRTRELALGRFDPRTLEACTRLADALLRCKRRQEAEKMLLRTLEIQVEQLGEKHPETNGTRTRLAELYFQASELVKAGEQYKAVLRSHTSPSTKRLQYARALCEIMMFGQHFRESAELRGELAAAQARLHGELDSRSLRSFREQVVALAQIPDVDAMQDVVDHLVKLAGEDHIDSIASKMWVGSVLQKLKRFDESREILQSTYDRAKSVLGEENTITVQAGTVLAVTLHQCGDVVEAESLQRSMLAVNEKTAGERSFAMFRSVAHLGSLCVELDKLDEAYELVLRAAEVRKHIKEHDHHIIQNGSKVAELLEQLQAKGVEIDLDVYEATLISVRDSAAKKGDTALSETCTEKLSALAVER